jgi:hypothetical protein
MAVGREPNGTNLIALGDQDGSIKVFFLSPGGSGVLTYEGSLYQNLPVLTMTAGVLTPGGNLSVAMTSGSDIFVLSPSDGGWTLHTLVTVPRGSVAPSFTSISFLMYPDGLPALVVSDSMGGVLISNWTGTGQGAGWNNPLTYLLRLPSTHPIRLSSTATPTAAKLAVGDGPMIGVYNVSRQNVSLTQNVSLPNSDNVTGVVFNGNGSELIASSGNGIVYSCDLAGSSVPEVIYSSNQSLVSVAYYGSSSREIIATVSHGNKLTAILNPWTDKHVLQVASYPYENQMGGIAFGAMNDTLGDDVVLSSSNSLFTVPAEFSFNSTMIGDWLPGIQHALNATAGQTSLGENGARDIPISLTSRNCAVHILSSFVMYNTTQTVSVGAKGTYQRNANGTMIYLPLTISAMSAGGIHIAVTLAYSIPPQPGSPSWFEDGASWLAGVVWRSLVWVILSIALVGIALYGGGQVLYWRRNRESHVQRGKPTSKAKE